MRTLPYRLPHSNHIHRWTVSYADYMTLMFALFVVLYAVSLNKEDNYQEVIERIQAASQFLPVNTSTANADGILTKLNNDINEERGPAILSDGTHHQLGYVSELPSEEMSHVQQYHTGEPLAILQLALQSALASELEAGALSVDLNGDWLTIEMSGPVLFLASSHTLLNSAKKQIQSVAEALKPVNNMIRLRGYTDSQTVSDELYRSNWELSALRAINVLHAFKGHGVDEARMVIEGFGKLNPVLKGNGEIDNLKSRRVVIAISKFAILPSSTEQGINFQRENENTGEEVTLKGESNKMREVHLPDGRLIITTRQE